MTSNQNQLGKIRSLARDLQAIFGVLPRRRRVQLGGLLALQLAGAASEVLSLGALLPFLRSLSDTDALLAMPELKPWLDMIGAHSGAGVVSTMAGLFAGSILLVNALRVATLWAQARISSAIATELSVEIYDRTLHQPYKFHTDTNSNLTISVIANDLSSMMIVVRSLMMLITHGLVVLAIFSALIAYSPLPAVIVIASMLGAYTLISRINKPILVRNGKISSDNFRTMMKTLQEGIGGIRDVILDNSQSTFVRHYNKSDRKMRRARANIRIVKALPRYVLEMLGVLTVCLVISTLAWTEFDTSNLLPIVGALAAAASRLLPAMQRVYSSFASMQGAHISMKRALVALARSRPSVEPASLEERLDFSDKITLEGVWYTYSDDHEVSAEADWTLRDVTVDIVANTTVALAGATGSGKSTTADLLLGLLSPQKGQLRVDGTTLDSKNIGAWRNSVATVSQHIFLSDATIKENIAFGVPVGAIDMDRVRVAARMARIDEFIESRPVGYNEIIGERGVRLSGGQRQRIGIARALYKRTPVIVFDEATSALDTLTEAEVMEAIAGLSGKVTMVIIAHRLSTIRMADKIYEIQDGRVTSSGTFSELVKTSESFRKMAAQLS